MILDSHGDPIAAPLPPPLPGPQFPWLTSAVVGIVAVLLAIGVVRAFSVWVLLLVLLVGAVSVEPTR